MKNVGAEAILKERSAAKAKHSLNVSYINVHSKIRIYLFKKVTMTNYLKQMEYFILVNFVRDLQESSSIPVCSKHACLVF